MRIKILASAMEDLYTGRLFYEKQGEGLGEYFFDSIFSDIDSLTLYGGIHRETFGCHRMLSKRFPYAIYYRIEAPSIVVVWRILDLRRDPKRIRHSLIHEKSKHSAHSNRHRGTKCTPVQEKP
jgi:hypothetical protein